MKSLLKAVLYSPPTTQKAVLGCAYKIKQQEMDGLIEGLFDIIGETDYHHPMHENRDAFLELLKEQWADFT